MASFAPIKAIACLSTVFALLLAGASSALADVRYAEVGGDGPQATCPQSDPCSLDNAVEDASVQNGDEVIVLPGTYSTLTGDMLVVSDAINLHGQAGAPRPVVTESTSNPTLFSNVGGVSIHDLEFVNTSNGSAVNLGPVFAGGITMERVVATASTAGAFGCQIHNTVAGLSARSRHAPVAIVANG